MFSIPRLRYDRIYWVLFLVIIVVILIGAAMHKKNSFAANVDVEVVPLADGDKLISEKDVEQALLKSFGNTLEGTELARLDIERMERVLEEDAFVADADAYVDQNNILHIRIKQRAPILRVLDSNGGNYYLDEYGTKMPPSKNFTARVLVATGNISPYNPDFLQKKRTSLKDLYALTKTILADEFMSTLTQQIHVNAAGDFILTPLIGDQRIILGNVRRLEDKIRRLKIFYQEGMPYAGWKKYSSINLKYSGQVVCRK